MLRNISSLLEPYDKCINRLAPSVRFQRASARVCFPRNAMRKPRTLQDAVRYFSDEQVCISLVGALRWPKGPECPRCHHTQPKSATKGTYYSAKYRRWKCRKCTCEFSVKMGSVFEGSHISLQMWLVSLWLLVNSKKRITAYRLGLELGINHRSSMYVLDRLRFALHSGKRDPLDGDDNKTGVDVPFAAWAARFMTQESRKLTSP